MRYVIPWMFAWTSLLLSAPVEAWTLEQTFKITGRASEGASYGASLAMDGDVAVVGAPSFSNDEPPVNAVDVLGRQGPRWLHQQWIESPTGSSRDGFGGAVSVEDGVLVVGAPLEDEVHADAGAAYVYRRSGGTWALEARLTSDAPSPDLWFGGAVAVGGGRVVIAESGVTNTGVSGRVFVFRDTAAGWELEAALGPVSDFRRSGFGRSLDISGDTIVVGAPEVVERDYHTGAAYVFEHGTAGWRQVAMLRLEAAAQDGAKRFGQDVAVGDGTLVVSEQNYVYTWAGRRFPVARVYQRHNGSWEQRAALTVRSVDYGSPGGGALAIDGDTILVGSDDARIRGSQSGAAYVFQRESGHWHQQATLLASDAAPSTLLGNVVALQGDVALVGAPNDQEAHGSAYVFQLVEAGPFVQCPGDLDGDGAADLVVVSAHEVVVQDLQGVLHHRFALGAAGVPVRTALMTDSNGNGAPELAVLRADPPALEVWDLASGGQLAAARLSPARVQPLDLEVMPDRNGNGVAELSVLTWTPRSVRVIDGLLAEALAEVEPAVYVTPRDLQIFPDSDGNGWPELSVLGDNQEDHRVDRLALIDPARNAVVDEHWLFKGWRMIAHSRLTDVDGNGSDEVAVLRYLPEGRVNVHVRDLRTEAWTGFIGFPRAYPPRSFAVLPDLNGNGADELMVFGRHRTGEHQKAVIKDGRSGHRLAAIAFDPTLFGQEVVPCGDVNGNGSTDLAFVGWSLDDPARKAVIVKDAGTGQRLNATR